MLEPVNQQYRCYIIAISKGFFAACIDLDLAVEHETPDGAILSLKDAMTGYLEVVRDGTAPNELFWPYRQTPFWDRIRYYFALQFKQGMTR